MNGKRKTRKSHHGCSECKRRSVKCDEKLPQCSNCVNRRSTCHYATKISGCHDLTTRPESINHGTTSTSSPFNIPHLRLLLNWTTSTCHSISRHHADSPIWQTVIPQRALSCPYLLHGIFAVSALHLALSSDSHGTDQQALIEAAEHHQSEAIRMFTGIDNQLGPSDPLAGFALSSLLIGAAFAFPLAVATRCQTKANWLNELIELFMLIRKMINFSTPSIGGVQNSELGDLLLVEDVQSSLSESSHRAIEALYELLNAEYPPSHENHQAFADTIDCLENLLSKLDGGVEMVSGSFMWVCDVPATFIDLVQGQDALALVILAHYCVVLHWLRKRWWISSWGERVLDAIVERLSPAWKPSLAWPLHAVNTPYSEY